MKNRSVAAALVGLLLLPAAAVGSPAQDTQSEQVPLAAPGPPLAPGHALAPDSPAAPPSPAGQAPGAREPVTLPYPAWGIPAQPYMPPGHWVWDPARGVWYWVIVVPPPPYYVYYLYYPYPHPYWGGWWVIEGLGPGPYKFEPNPDFEKFHPFSWMFSPPRPPEMTFKPGESPSFPWARTAPAPAGESAGKEPKATAKSTQEKEAESDKQSSQETEASQQ